MTKNFQILFQIFSESVSDLYHIKTNQPRIQNVGQQTDDVTQNEKDDINAVGRDTKLIFRSKSQQSASEKNRYCIEYVKQAELRNPCKLFENTFKSEF